MWYEYVQGVRRKILRTKPAVSNCKSIYLAICLAKTGFSIDYTKRTNMKKTQHSTCEGYALAQTQLPNTIIITGSD